MCLTGYWPETTGPSRGAALLAHELSKKGVQVFVVAYWRPGLRKVEKVDENYIIHRVPVLDKSRGLFPYVIGASSSLSSKILRLNTRHRFSILHSHLVLVPAIGCLIPARIGRVPCVLKYGGDTVSEMLHLTDAEFKGGTLESWSYPRFRARAAYLFQRQLFQSYDHVYATTRYGYDLLRKMGLERDRISIVPQAIDLDTFKRTHSRKKEELGLRGRVILGVGRFVKGKGFQDLIEAFGIAHRECPDSHLLIVGEGPLRRELEAFASEIAPGHVTFATAVKQTDIVDYYSAAEAYVHTSYYDQNIANPILEAMACETPVIAYENPSIGEVIRHEETGMVVKRGDIPSLGAMIVSILKDERKARYMAIRAKDLIEKEFRPERMVEAIIRIYAKLSPRS